MYDITDISWNPQGRGETEDCVYLYIDFENAPPIPRQEVFFRGQVRVTDTSGEEQPMICIVLFPSINPGYDQAVADLIGARATRYLREEKVEDSLTEATRFRRDDYQPTLEDAQQIMRNLLSPL